MFFMRRSFFRFCLLFACAACGFACPVPSSSRESDEPAGQRLVETVRSGGRPQRPPGGAVTREAMISAINAERRRAGVSPLRSDPALDRVAQERADAIAKKGALPNEAQATGALGAVQRRLAQEGYTAHGWVESIVVSDGDAPAVIAYWRGDPSFGDALRADYSDLGLGIARLGDTPLYTLLVAWPETAVYNLEVRDLTDLAAVRREMLAGVNRLRKAAGVQPLSEDARLDAAAQEHAEDMSSRGYYDHQSPEGKNVGDRLHAEGYVWRLAAENLAAGHFTVESALDAWMKSSGHRANLLHKDVTDFGFGIAVGPMESKYRVLWVQTFGAPLAD